VVTKLADRGTFQALGLVTDLEPFLRELTEVLAVHSGPSEVYEAPSRMNATCSVPADYFGIEYDQRGYRSGAPTGSWRMPGGASSTKRCCTWAEVELVGPRPGLPDMVFTANAGLAVGHRAFLEQFRHAERQRGRTSPVVQPGL
jgi:hypothetical protein